MLKDPAFCFIKLDVLPITSALGRLCLRHHQCLLQTLIMFVTFASPGNELHIVLQCSVFHCDTVHMHRSIFTLYLHVYVVRSKFGTSALR